MKSDRHSATENNPSASLEFSISRYHRWRHIIALMLTGGLCLSMVMSELSYHMHPGSHHGSHLNQMLVPYLLMVTVVGSIALGAILTACRIKIRNDSLEINNLFWQERLTWSDLKSFNSPPNLKFAWLKTKHCFYILAKNEFKDWLDLERELSDRKIKS